MLYEVITVGEVGTAPITVEKLARALRMREKERGAALEETGGVARGGGREPSSR